MKKYVENNFASFLLEKGILHICYKEDVSLLLRGAMEIVAQRLILQQGKAYPVLCHIRGLREVSRDAQKYLAVEGSLLIKALALVYTPPLSRVFFLLYLQNFPPIPIKIFTEEARALEFLAPFREPDPIDP